MTCKAKFVARSCPILALVSALSCLLRWEGVANAFPGDRMNIHWPLDPFIGVHVAWNPDPYDFPIYSAPWGDLLWGNTASWDSAFVPGCRYRTGYWLDAFPASPDSHFDGLNTIGYGSLGQGVLAYTESWPESDGRTWREVDMVISNTVPWVFSSTDADKTGPDYENFWLQAVARHEFGHGAGLYFHEYARVAQMNPVYRWGAYCERSLHGDDRNGIRTLYPGPGIEIDLALVGWKMAGGGEAVAVDVPHPAEVFTGDTLVVEVAAENLGTVTYNDFPINFYLSTDGYISVNDSLLGTTSVSLPAAVGGNAVTPIVTLNLSFTVPQVASGDYYVVAIIDPSDILPESREANNTIVLPYTDAPSAVHVTNRGEPGIIVTSPNGGEVWAVGDNHTITWVSNLVPENVRIEINRDYPGGNWETIAASVPNSGGCDWVVSGPGTTAARVRISSTVQDTVSDMSNASFTIGTRSLTVVEPNGGEVWLLNVVRNILWSSTVMSENVKLEINYDFPGPDWTTIVASTPNSGSFPWTVSGPITNAARIRVSGVTHSSVADISDANFSISPMSSVHLTLISPNGGETWGIGDSNNIIWTSNLSENVKVEINRSYPGSSWETIVASTPNSGSFAWLVTSLATTTARVRVSGTTLTSIADTSDTNFTIGAVSDSWAAQTSGTTSDLGGLSFVSDLTGWAGGIGGLLRKTTNGGLNWSGQNSGQGNMIWSVRFVNETTGWVCGTGGFIRKSTDGGSSWTAQTSGTTQNIIDMAFHNANTGWAVDVGGGIRKTTNGGTNWVAQTSGTTNLLDGVSFTSADSGWVVGDVGTIRRTTDGGINWTAQSSGTTSRLTSVVFVDRYHGWAVGYSGVIRATTDGGADWFGQTSGTAQDLWRVAFVDRMNGWAVGDNGTIVHTTNGGSSWVSETSGTTASLRGLAARNPDLAWADGFTGVILRYLVNRTVVVSSPNGSEQWGIGEADSIRWTSSNLLENVRIELNRSYPGGLWDVIAASAPNTGLYIWPVSGPSTTTARIRISGTIRTYVSDISNANFTVLPRSLSLVAPNGGESWSIGSTQWISWSSQNVSGYVRIELNRSYPGGDWESIVASVSNSGSYPWMVTGPATTAARVRLSSISYATVGDTSQNNFTIYLPNDPPEIIHDLLHDQTPVLFTVTAEVTDDYPGFVTHMLYWPKSGGASDSTELVATLNPDEFATSVGPLPENTYCYFLRVTDAGGLTASTDSFCFEVRAEWGALQVYDDGTAEASHWSENSDYLWAVKFDVPTPYCLYGAYIGVSAEHPDALHSPIRVQVFLSDGLGGLPGTSMWSKVVGSIGNVIGGIPADSDGWVYVAVRDSLGHPLLMTGSFYLAVGNETIWAQESFLDDTAGTPFNRSYVYDPCDSMWFAESDADSSCRGGNRMIRVSGSVLTPPNIVVYRSGNDMQLYWNTTGALCYKIYSATTVQGPYTTLEGTATTNNFTDEGAAAEVRKFYIVQASTTP